MNSGIQTSKQSPLTVRVRFCDDISEAEENALWQEVFNILDVFDDEHMGKEMNQINT